MHLGNYLGAVKQWVDVQNSDAYYCVVDLHALTLEIAPDVLREQTTDCVATLLACGIDPEVSALFIQSHVAYHSQMSWLLECVASYGELSRMTQFKEKAERKEGYRVGLLTYPVLMSADILLYDTEQVPVGDDQRQHLELTRNVAERFNARYGPTLTVPLGVQPTACARILDLQDPSRKMSKSISSPLGSIYLMDDPAEITKKIKRAVTDTDNEVRYDPEHKPGLSNLLELYSNLSGESPAEVASKYSSYGDLKGDLAQLVIEELTPIAKTYVELRRSPDVLAQVVARGAEKASTIAGAVYRRAASAMGLN